MSYDFRTAETAAGRAGSLVEPDGIEPTTSSETESVCRDCMVGDAGIELMAIAAWHPLKTKLRVADFVRETI